jgi:hypothetical protein
MSSIPKPEPASDAERGGSVGKQSNAGIPGSLADRGGVIQHITAVAGFAYGVIGADMHVLGDGTPLYMLENYRRLGPADPNWLREMPSRMLNARFAVVEFTGRESEQEDLLTWCQHGPRLAVRWLQAPGGQGKTRLAAQVAERMIGARWKVVTSTYGPGAILQTGGQDMRVGEAAGLLLIVDYADRWPLTHLTWLLSNALLHQPETPTRVLLIARTAEAWSSLREALSSYQAGVSQQRLASLPDRAVLREQMFNAARDAFAAHYRISDASVIAPPADLEAPEWGLTLTVHMAALVSVDAHSHGRPAPQDPIGLTGYLLDRERAHWTRLYENRAQSGQVAAGLEYQTPRSVMSRAVFTAALTGSADHLAAKSILDGLDLELPSDRILIDHQTCYPPADPRLATFLEPLYPDRLAEDYLGVTMPGHTADQPSYAWAPSTARTLLNREYGDSPAAYVSRAITFLAAAADRWPHVGETFMYPMLRHEPQVAIDAGSAALIALARLPQIPIDLLDAIERLFPPERHVDLDPGIAAIVRRLTEHRLAVEDEPHERAGLYLNLGTRLSNAGDHRQALHSFTQATEIYRGLAAADPQDVELDLAKSLNNLGQARQALGQWADALAATNEAVGLFRQLKGEDPVGLDPGLATALSNLGLMQSHFGRREEALRTTEEAVAIRRRLAADDPAAFEADLAGSLNNLGVMQSALGKQLEALPTAEESVELFRRLAAANPTAFEPGFATALNNLGNRMRYLGRWEEGLRATQEAVPICRRLVSANPAAYELELAMLLANLGNDMSYLGQRDEALAATREAVELYRRRAADNPPAVEPRLAMVLDNLGSDLSGAGQLEAALAAVQEAVAIYRRLAADNPAGFEPHLAGTLGNLGNHLANLGRRDESMVATREALEIYRRLAAANQDVFEPRLAGLLDNLATDLAEAGHLEEALALNRESVELYRRLATITPAAYEPDLAAALNNLGHHMATLDRHAEALAAVQEAVAIYRRLAQANPAASLPRLASYLGNLSQAMSALGRHEEALATAQEAAQLSRRLAAANPAAFEPTLATALGGVARCMSELGRREEALAAVQEAVEIFRPLAATQPTAFEPNLGAILDNFGKCLSDLGRHDAALAATMEAVGIFRRLAAAQPAVFESHLAQGLLGFGRVRSTAGLELPQALDAVQESIAMYRRLAQQGQLPFTEEIRVATDALASLLEKLGRTQEAATIRLEIKRRDPARAD